MESLPAGYILEIIKHLAENQSEFERLYKIQLYLVIFTELTEKNEKIVDLKNQVRKLEDEIELLEKRNL